MKCYNAHTYEKLGFDQILEDLKKRVLSESTKKHIDQIRPIHDPNVLLPELDRVEEFSELLAFDDPFPIDGFLNVENTLGKLALEGNWLSAQEIFRLLRWMRAISAVRQYLHQRREKYPQLHVLANTLGFPQSLIKKIESVLDDYGNVRDNASPELVRIRRQLKKSSGELRTTLYRILKNAQANNWSLEQEITLRNDRLVIPVRAEAKGRVPGFVQDVSQSGGTVYIEPTQALPLNNKIRELQIQEHNELVRILQEISISIRGHAHELTDFQEILIQVDLIRGKAIQAQELEGIRPQVDPNGKRLILQQAYYPLLLFKAQQEKMEVIPLDISLNTKRRILLISGPNAGGKSVSLKTVGLLQIMLQSGFLIPVAEGSVFRLFDSLFLDIGDEQSVDSDLSTYTSRLFQWRQMGDHMRDKALFLVDEFGSGTDPKQGGAIAESFLERFVRQRAFGIITTHYGNLKDYAEITSGIVNAAMQFDTKGLRPTFRLIEGMPGRSYAFEMAKRVGVHPSILKKARAKVGTDEIDSEKLLKELERKNAQLSRLIAENKKKSQKLEGLLERNETKEQILTKDRKKILRQAQMEAKQLIQDANKQIERTIREIREQQAEKEKTLALRKQLAAAAPKVDPPIPEELHDPPSQTTKGKKSSSKKKKSALPNILPNAPMEVGSWVKLKQSTTIGQLEDIQGKKAIVSAGGMKLTINLKQLVRIQTPESQTSSGISVVRSTKPKAIPLEINVMGKRVDEALNEMERWLDDANVAGFRHLRILHGKGTGALREALRSHLWKMGYVKQVQDAPVDQGGAGWTLIELEE
ncbi:MAG: Smr/MutS family protein [Bacteroidota bacterium]